MEIKIKYRLLRLNEKRINHTEHIELINRGEPYYGGVTDIETHTFESVDLALEHAKNDSDWHFVDFTILPVYRIYNF